MSHLTLLKGSHSFMKFLLTILTILLISIVAVGDTVETAPTEMVAIDMRHGLPESRVRALRVLPDGRLAVATAGYLSIFDGTGFVNEPIDDDKGIALTSRGKGRQLFYDHDGILWLKTPLWRKAPTSPYAETGKLHAFDSNSGKNITDKAVEVLGKGVVCDFFVDDKGGIWIIDADKYICAVDHGRRKKIANIGSVANELPSAIHESNGKMYLCYDNGNVCVVNLHSGLLEYMSRATLPKMRSQLINGRAKWLNGKLWLSFQRHNHNDSSWLASLDTVGKEWNVRRFDRLVFDFYVYGGDSVVYSFPGLDDKVFCMEQDRKGGMWIGTGNSGLRHIAPSGGRLITVYKGDYPYPGNGYFPDEKAKASANKYASGILNGSAVDSITGYVYLATRKGLMVVDGKGKLMATLNNNVGLPNDNVQGVIANVGSRGNKKVGGEVWFTTTTGLSRLRHLPGDTLEVINLGILDGLDLNGKEFSTQSMAVDSLGFIVAGFPGGWCRFNPAAVDGTDHVVHKYPDGNGNGGGDKGTIAGMHSYIFWICVGVVVVAILLFALMVRRRKKPELSVDTAPEGTLNGEAMPDGVPESQGGEAAKDRLCDTLVGRLRETARQYTAETGSSDIEFVARINKIIESHLDDETLSVVSLSSMMAMDRTNLYRKMQSVMGESPSAYIKNMRLSVAARLLKETDLPMSDVALRTGFSSTKYFSASFKDKFGMLPAKYRKS